MGRVGHLELVRYMPFTTRRLNEINQRYAKRIFSEKKEYLSEYSPLLLASQNLIQVIFEIQKAMFLDLIKK